CRYTCATLPSKPCRSNSMTFVDRLRLWFVNLRYFVPGFFVFAAAALLDHPATILLSLAGAAATTAAVAYSARLVREQGFAPTLLRRALPHLIALLLYGLLVALLVAYPLRWLARDLSLSATLAVTTEVVVALLGLWRVWPAFGLLF